MSQANLWELYVHQREDAEERPRKGWVIFENKPSGKEPITSRRGKSLKFKHFGDALDWITQKRRGYRVNVRCCGYRGMLSLE